MVGPAAVQGRVQGRPCSFKVGPEIGHGHGKNVQGCVLGLSGVVPGRIGRREVSQVACPNP